jgi:hypothetical protein
VRVELKNNKLPAIAKALRRLGRARVEVGILGDARNAMVAAVAEYGTASIPARGFLTRPLALHRPEHIAALGRIADRVMRGEDPDVLLGRLGLKAVADIREWVTAGRATPPNSPKTIARKGSSTPLIDTGELVGSLQHRVVVS